MKKLLLVAGVAISCGLSAQWDTVNTGRSDLDYHSIEFYDANNGLLVGYDTPNNYGYALQTSDGGNTWSDFFSFTLDRFDIDFTPDGSVWVVGDSGRVILKNFPLSNHIYSGNLATWTLYCGSVINDSAFVCAGENGVVFRTYNYGQNWDTITTSGTTETINDIYFANAANGWIVCNDGYMAATTDSGNTWQFVAQPMWGFVDIMSFDYQGSSGMNPYLVGSLGVANFSVNNGANWSTIASGTGGTLQQIRFGTDNAGLIVGDNGYILRTVNGGWTWFADSSSETVDFFDIAYAGDTTAFICGDSGVVLRSRMDISAVQNHTSNLFSVAAYPNPTNGPINLNMMLPVESDLTIDVMDVTGNIVHTEYHENVIAGENNMALDLSSNAAGIYFVRISNGFSAVNMHVIRK